MTDRNDTPPEPTGPADASLLDELGATVGRADPVPDDLVAAARASFTWRTIDEELAALVFDSAVDELVGVRSTVTAPRLLSFEGDGGAVEIEVAEGRLVGLLEPAAAAEVELRRPAGVRTTQADGQGRFSFDLRVSSQPDGTGLGPVSLRVVGPGLRLVTGWIVL
jgi:hypothetical protein